MAHLLNIIVSTVVICLCIECMQLNINAMDEKWNGMEKVKRTIQKQHTEA